MRNLLVSFSILAFSSLSFAADAKKSVAVLNFDYATVQSGVAAIFGTNQDIGKGVADLLVEAGQVGPISRD